MLFVELIQEKGFGSLRFHKQTKKSWNVTCREADNISVLIDGVGAEVVTVARCKCRPTIGNMELVFYIS